MKLKKLKKSLKVDPPKGFHWMLENGRFYLMKGDYKPHKGAVPQADFRLVTHDKGAPDKAMDAARKARS
tara:strand:- start:3149 stop:3355 length:207 start_codon:yes stop_codon:yes gene_type:complete